jgi:hypothetical protein
MHTRHLSATGQVAKCESARSPRQVSSLRPSRAPATAVSRATIHSERATRAERTPGSIRSAGCGAERAAQRHPVLRYSGTKVRSPTWRCQSLRALARRGVAGWTPSLTSSQLVRGGRAIDLIVTWHALGRLATTKFRRSLFDGKLRPGSAKLSARNRANRPVPTDQRFSIARIDSRRESIVAMTAVGS